MTDETNHRIDGKAEAQRIMQITRGLIGQECWMAHLSYGGELRLEFGARLPYPHPALARMYQGEWMLGTRASSWRIESDGSVLVDSDAEEGLVRERITALQGLRVGSFFIAFPSLDVDLQFENDISLLVIPEKSDDSNLADWELFMPDSRLLKVGPGNLWSLQQSDKPMDDD